MKFYLKYINVLLILFLLQFCYTSSLYSRYPQKCISQQENIYRALITDEYLKLKYPHWDLSKKVNVDILIEIAIFIKMHKKGGIAVIDLDGTLCQELVVPQELFRGKGKPRSGQSAWRIWAANNYFSFENAFPKYTKNVRNKEPLLDLIREDEKVEGHTTGRKTPSIEKFDKISTFEEGMTPKEMTEGLNKFFEKYDISIIGMFPVLDILQNMLNNGINVWVISGSNPYYASIIFKQAENRYPNYYKFGNLSKPFQQPSIDKNGNLIFPNKIIGNFALLGPNGRFTGQRFRYNMFMPEELRNDFVIAGNGKAKVIQHIIEPIEGKKPVFWIGNSDNDYDMARYILQGNPIATGIFVDPLGRLKAYYDKNKDIPKFILLETPKITNYKTLVDNSTLSNYGKNAIKNKIDENLYKYTNLYSFSEMLTTLQKLESKLLAQNYVNDDMKLKTLKAFYTGILEFDNNGAIIGLDNNFKFTKKHITSKIQKLEEIYNKNKEHNNNNNEGSPYLNFFLNIFAVYDYKEN